MNIGELFVNLGIKGGKDTQNTLKGVKGGMRDVKSISLEAKAAILATIYTLKNLMQQSTQNGVALTQFSNLTGLSTKKLQQWQFANKQAGGTAEEVTGVVTSMQQAFAQLELGEGPAKYLGVLAEGLAKVGDSLDVKKMNDSFYTLEKFRTFLKAGGTGKIGIDNEVGASLGISPGMIAGMRGGMFEDKILNSASVYSDKQSKALQNVNAEWVKLSDHIQKTIGQLNVQFGAELVKNIGGVVKELANVVKELMALSKEIALFEHLKTVLQNIGNILSWITGMLDEAEARQKGWADKDDGKFMKTAKGGVSLGKTILDILALPGVAVHNALEDYSIPNLLKKAMGSDVVPLGTGSMAGSAGGSGSGAPTIINQQTINVGNNANVPAIREGARTGANQGVKAAYGQQTVRGL